MRELGFREILMSVFSLLSQKTYPGEFSRPEVILSRSYLRKCCIWLPPIIINLSFFKNDINLDSKTLRPPPSYILNVWSLNTGHAVFFMLRGKPVLSFSKKFSRYQNSEILSCLNVMALSNFYIYIRSLQV